MNKVNGCAAPIPTLDIPVALEELSSHLYSLEERIEALRERLKPALVVADTKAETATPTLAKATSQIAECIEGYSDRVSLANYKLDRLLAELQI